MTKTEIWAKRIDKNSPILVSFWSVVGQRRVAKGQYSGSSGAELLLVWYTGLVSLDGTVDLLAGDIQFAEILNGIRLPFGLIFLVKIDHNLTTGGIVYPLHLAVSEPKLLCLFCILKNMLLGNPWQFVIDILPISSTGYSVILLSQ